MVMATKSRVSMDEEERQMAASALEHIDGVCRRMHPQYCGRPKCVTRRTLIDRLTDNRPGRPYPR